MRDITTVEDLESLTPAEWGELLAEAEKPQPWCGTCVEIKRQQTLSRMRELAQRLDQVCDLWQESLDANGSGQSDEFREDAHAIGAEIEELKAMLEKGYDWSSS